ncbi:MAG: hypothetical protein AB8G99_21610 [Planctomycetaceae bacterium]
MCGPALGTAAACGAGIGAMAAGPVPITTQVPVTTYRNVTVDMGSYQRVWVPRLVTQRVPQTTYQSRTVWMNQGAAQPWADTTGGAMLPLAPGVVPGMALPSTSAPMIDGSMVPGGTMLPGSTLPLGSPYGGSMLPYSGGTTIDSGTVYPGTTTSPGLEIPSGGLVPMPPSAYAPTTMQSASLPRSTYSDGYVNHDPAHVSDYPAGNVTSDASGSFDDWVDVEPTGSAARTVTQSVTPDRYERRTTSGLFSPVRPGSMTAQARYAR